MSKYLTRNAYNNLQALIALSFNTHYLNIYINKVNETTDDYQIKFTRKIKHCDLNELNNFFELNRYYSCDVHFGYELLYEINIHKPIFSAEIECHLLSNRQFIEANVKHKLDDCENQINESLGKYKDLLLETIWPTDEEVNDYTFYYIAKTGCNIAFANKTYNHHSLKIDINESNDYSNEVYKHVFTLRGTENDAKIMMLRRNFNSNYYNDWKYCKINTPIITLLLSNCLN